MPGIKEEDKKRMMEEIHYFFKNSTIICKKYACLIYN